MNKNLIKFLSKKNTVLIRDERNFRYFIETLRKYDLEYILGAGTQRTFDYWSRLRESNEKPNCVNPGLCFEYDVDNGLTFYTDIQNSIEWYGVDPFEPKELI